MRHTLTAFAALLACTLTAQYGTVEAKAVTTAQALTTLVVLDNGDSPFNRAIMDAVKSHWKFTGSYDFIHVRDLAVAPLAVDKIYLMKTVVNDPERHQMTFVSLVQGWKQKKGETMEAGADGAFTTIPGDRVLASIQCDPQWLADHKATAMYVIYMKHLQDFLKQVEAGKVIDKATADRLYQGRNRVLRDDMNLMIAADHLDKSLPDLAAVKAHYTHEVQVGSLAACMEAVAAQDPAVAVTDVVLTGDHKTKWCFKRIFNAGTGELMYQRDEAALFGKKEGFLDEDLKQLERAR